MTKTALFDKVRNILAEHLGIESDNITRESNLTEDLGADSLDEVELVMELEEEFDTEISDEAAETFKTAGSIAAYLESILDITED